MSTFVRVKALISRFDDEKFEDLFAICCTQIAKIYDDDPYNLHTIIIDTLKQLIVSRKTYKRLICGSLFTKILEMYASSENQEKYIFDGDQVKFDPRLYLNDIQVLKKGKEQLEIENRMSVINMDEMTQDQIKNILIRKENFLYSKSEKSIVEKEKKNKQNGKDYEEQFLEQFNEDMIKNPKSNGEFYKEKNKIDPRDTLQITEFEKDINPNNIDCKKIKNPKTIFNYILELSEILIFHPNWEFRHGALIVFRTIARNFLQFPYIPKYLSESSNNTIEIIDGKISKIYSVDISVLSLKLNENLKQKCLILISLDRFSDFISDKSNMANRALAIDILVLLFENNFNFENYYFLYEALIIQTIKSGWEPKQAFMSLASKIIDSCSNKIMNNSQILINLLNLSFKFSNEHEEITEAYTSLIQSTIVIKFNLLNSTYFENIMLSLLKILQSIEEISYLSKSIFETFSLFLNNYKCIGWILKGGVSIISKFIFHENLEVRRELFNFVKKIFMILNEDQYDLENPEILIDFFKIILISNVCSKSENINIDISNDNFVILSYIVKLIVKYGFQETIIDFSVSLLNNDTISSMDVKNDAIKNIELNEKLIKVNSLNLICCLSNILENIFLTQVTNNLNLKEFINKNNLFIAPIVINSLLSKEDLNQLINNVLINPNFLLVVNVVDQRIESKIIKIKKFLIDNTTDIDFEKNHDLELKIEKLLYSIENVTIFKTNIISIDNILKELSKLIKKGIEHGSIPYFKLKMILELEGSIIPNFELIFKKYNQLMVALKCIASYSFLNQIEISGILPDRKYINPIVISILQCFEIFENNYIISISQNCLILLNNIYKKEEKHPNNKILQAIINKSKSNELFLKNSINYIKLLVICENNHILIRYPEFIDILKSKKFISELLETIIGVYNNNFKPFFEDYVFDLIKNPDVDDMNDFKIIVLKLFKIYNDLYKNGNLYCLNILLEFLFNSLLNNEQYSFVYINVLIESYANEFRIYSNIFVNTILKSINTSKNHQIMILSYETFSKIISLAYLESDPVLINGLNETLRIQFFKGNKFIYDFKNQENFSICLENILNTKIKLKQYQYEGIRWLNFLLSYNLSACLADDMGLGKTVQSLVAVALTHNQEISTKNFSLIICPNSLTSHWERECKNFINDKILIPAVLSTEIINLNTKLSIFISKNPDYNLFICSYNQLNKIVDFVDINIHCIILDEAHLIKNPKSNLSIRVKSISSNVRIAITGTPIQNSIAELWSIFDFLFPNYLGSKEDFKKQNKCLYDLNLMSVDLKSVELSQNQTQTLKNLHAKVLPFIMRREKSEVLKELPDKIIQDINCEMTTDQQSIYQDIEEKYLSIKMNNLEICQKIKSDQKLSFMSFLSKMRLLLNHPNLLDANTNLSGKNLIKRNSINIDVIDSVKDNKENHFYKSGKFIALKDLLNSLNYNEEDTLSCINNKNKIILFSRSVLTLEKIMAFLNLIFPLIKYQELSSKQNSNQRDEVIYNFNNLFEYKILLLTPKIGGLGLNLTSANIVIMFDHDFNPMNDLQAMDRAHRLGQKSTVNVFRLITNNTLEEKIMGIQNFKKSIANTVVNIENSSIKNVQESNILQKLEVFVNETVNDLKKNENKKDMTVGNFGKYLEGSELMDLWNDDEYIQEYL